MKTDVLAKRLTAASKNYYSTNKKTLISDAQFDEMKAELRAKDPNHPFLTQTGSLVPAAATKIKHATVLGSLDNAFGLQDIVKWMARVQGQKPQYVVGEEKADGLTVNLSYRGGKLAYAATRGDGVEGEDVTRNVAPYVPHTLEGSLINYDVRCEALIPRKVFEEFFRTQGYTNARAAASGTVRNKNGEMAKYLVFKAFSVVHMDGKPAFTYESESIKWLLSQGFKTVGCTKIKFDAEAIFRASEDFNEFRPTSDYEADGFVIKINDIAKQQAAGMSGNCPIGCIAIKWKGSMVAESVITGIITQVGKTGAITPVALIAPTECGGVFIERISLMNWDEIERIAGEKKIGVGAKVKIERSGEVVPRMTEVIDDTMVTCAFQRPEHCPSCGAEAVSDGPRQMCKNPECPAQSFRRVLNWIKGRNILHFGDKTLDALMAVDGPISTIADIYSVTEEDMAKAAGDAMASKILREIRKTVSTLPHQLLGNVGISGIGETEAKKLYTLGDLSTWEGLSKARKEKWAPILGPVKATKFKNGIKKHENVIKKLYGMLKVASPKETAAGSTPWAGKTFCATGASDIDRPSLIKIIEGSGGIWKSSVVKGLDYLIMADPKLETTKAQKAKAQGVTLISEEDALRMTKT